MDKLYFFSCFARSSITLSALSTLPVVCISFGTLHSLCLTSLSLSFMFQCNYTGSTETTRRLRLGQEDLCSNTFVKKRTKGRLSKNKAARWSASQGVLNLLVHEAKVNEVLTDYCMRPGGTIVWGLDYWHYSTSVCHFWSGLKVRVYED